MKVVSTSIIGSVDEDVRSNLNFLPRRAPASRNQPHLGYGRLRAWPISSLLGSHNGHTCNDAQHNLYVHVNLLDCARRTFVSNNAFAPTEQQRRCVRGLL